MKALPTHCPRCNSSQSFVAHKRRLSARSWMDYYIRCKMCGWELVVRHTTDEIEMLRMRYAGLCKRVRYEQRRHGQASQTTINHRNEVGREWVAAHERLKAEVEASHER